jgi:hypothetical protein
MRKIIMALGMCVALVLGVGSASAVSRPGPVRAVKLPGLTHPCDINRDGRGSGLGSTEWLCLKVWGHDAYDVTDADGGMASSPAGPVVVVELVREAELEGAGVAYIREGLAYEVAQHARRDR